MHDTFDDAGNLVDELRDHDLFATDAPLADALAAAGPPTLATGLPAYGALLGRADTYTLAEQANAHPPELKTFDARGRRLDVVDFHPSWHALMAIARRQGLTTLPAESRAAGRWTAWAASLYLHGQVEAGTLCPATMTQAAVALLQQEPALWARLQAPLLSREHDPRDLPLSDKVSAWIGMGMTEKQGGSDVRTNTTAATADGPGGRGGAYRLRGHKWFFSAPMCDAHLVSARTAGGLSCFYVPRWQPDGRRNAVQIQRLKRKLGNRSNASSEVEFVDAHGILIGEEGRGIPTLIEMATCTRLSCVLGSAALLRQALVQGLSYARRRRAFGRALADQPLMQAVLVDLALESEANVVLMMRLARAFERDADAPPGAPDPAERAWKRIMTPAAKFWVCKRAVELTGEAMEVFGGNGYVEDSTVSRLFREAPVNSIWEGSGNVMCLDVLRAIARDPAAARDLVDGLADGGDPVLEAEANALDRLLTQPPDTLEPLGRGIVQRLVRLAQASLLRRHAPDFVADGFVRTRFDPAWGGVVGACGLQGLAVSALLSRALPAAPG